MFFNTCQVTVCEGAKEFKVQRVLFRRTERYLALLMLGLVAACGPTTPAPEVTAPAPVIEPAPQPLAEIHPREPANPERLMGQSPKAVQELMGAPTLVRRDDTVQVMLFENAACVFEVVFFEPDTDAYFEARHIAARTPGGIKVGTDECLAAHLPGGHWPDE